MSEDIAFKIQLGMILPQMKEKLAGDLSEIVDQLANFVKEGSREGDEFTIDPIKELIMKDLEIFLSDSILPEIEAKYNPPVEEEEEAAEGEGEAAEEEAAEE